MAAEPNTKLDVFYEPLPASDVPDAHKIEVSCFPPEEAASLAKFEYRQAHAPDLFLGCYVNEGPGRKLIGYVCSTLARGETLTHDSMSVHDPQGIALALLKEYIARLENARREGKPYERILLIAHDDLRTLYEKAGFEWLGESKVVHGPRPWYEMRKTLSAASAPTPAPAPPPEPQTMTSLPPNIWELLQQATTSRSVPTARLLPSFPNGLADVSESNPNSSDATNKHDLLCPRQGCGSIILKNKVAVLVERESVLLEPAEFQNPILAPIPAPPALVRWWRVTPNAMAFENIGFSKSVAPAGGKRLKLLSCAECDLGPLGWCEEGGSEFWLASNRVGYRTTN